jgi:RIO-like serine/threonine protein kinase
MNHDLYVLRALARLSRQRKTVDLESLTIRAGGSVDDVRAALDRLASAALVDRSGTVQEARLTMAGLAVAVASSASSTAMARASAAPRVERRQPRTEKTERIARSRAA